ncbi:MAG TPA: antibiotic biosynthesis monooxygenase [Thermomicrobiales bacterium]|nr:antibiotic biosynthesis monooxygenase [Thermomicrobiales bacterium]
MYVRSITFRARPEVTSEQASVIYHELTKIVAGEDGFLGSTFMMNADSNHAMSLTFWRDRDSGAAAGPKVLPMLLVKVHPLLVGPPEISGYDVIEQSFAIAGRQPS